MVADTWTAQEPPVLTYLVERFEAPDAIDVRTEEIADALGTPDADVGRSLRKLAGATPPYIQVHDPAGGAARPRHRLRGDRAGAASGRAVADG